MLQPGTYLGKYRIIRLIGSGGMADVYEAEDTTLGRHVALKVLPPEFARDPERIARFQKEVRATAQLSHPNIVTVYEVGEDKGYYFYSMQLVTGGDLKSRIRKGVTPYEALIILKQVAMALQEAHSHGFVHRDIKPENILFDDKGNALLTDLGIAKAIGSGTRLTKAGMSIGTPHYMSPEQARGLNVDGRSDLYSLGIVFYEMLTGNVPYDAEETFAIGLKHINDPIPELSPHLKEYQPIIDKLLAKDISDRYQSADELISDIEHISSGGSMKHPSHVFKRRGRTSKKSRPWIWTIGGAALAIIVVIFLYGNNLLNLLKPPPRIVIGGGSATVSHLPTPVKSTSKTPIPMKPISKKTSKNISSSKPLSAINPVSIAKKGRAIVYINSEPEGADVYLDGVYKGKTPFQANNFPSGKHEIMLKYKYYNPIKKELVFKNDIVYKKSYILKKGRGSITVLSSPEGATVYLDGKKQDGTTPLTLTNIVAGEHEIAIHKDRYYDFKNKIEVLPQKVTKLNATLAGGNLVLYKGKWVEPEKARKLREKDFEGIIEKAINEIRKENFKKAAMYIEYATNLFPSKKSFGNLLKKAKANLRNGNMKVARQNIESAVDVILPKEESKKINKEIDSAVFISSVKSYIQEWDFVKAKKMIEEKGLSSPSDPYIDTLLTELGKKIYQLKSKFVWVPGGCFYMGDVFGDGYNDEKPVHKVCLKGFYIGKYEVTFSQYDRFCKDTGKRKPSDEGWGRGNRPVINVSWYDAVAFAKWLSKKTGLKFRLPTEAEWEYAARSRGKKIKYATLTGYLSHDLANYYGTGGRDIWEHTSPVGSFPPNSLGLYDMSGNVWEWCADWYSKNYNSIKNKHKKVIRGGSWRTVKWGLRTTHRVGVKITEKSSSIGFRLVMEKQ